MALSYVQYQGNGSQQTFAIPFPYLDRSHIEVRVALDVTAYTWDDPGTIRITPAPFPGAVVEARRITPRENRMVDFVDSSVLTETDLDLAQMQTFYIVQEAIDIAGGTLELLSDGSYGAGGRRIKNVGSPIEARDAVTKEYHDGTWVPQMQALLNATVAARDVTVAARDVTLSARDAAIAARDLALQYRDTANTARAGALTSEQAAWDHRNAAATSASNAAGSASTANTHRTAAETARTGAEGARDTALTHRNSAQGFRNEAETFKNQAAASAAAAATFDPSSYVPKTGGTFSGDLTVVKNNARINLQRGDNAASEDYAGFNVFNTSGTYLSSFGYHHGSGTWRAGNNAVWHTGNFDPATKHNAGAGLSVTASLGTWSTAGWGVGLQLRQGNGIHWLSNGASNAAFYGVTGDVFYWGYGADALNGTVGTGYRMQLNTNGHLWLSGYGWLHDYVYAVGDARAAAHANAIDYVHRIRMVGYGEMGNQGDWVWGRVQPAVVTGARWVYGYVDAINFRTLQMHLPRHGGYHNCWVE